MPPLISMRPSAPFHASCARCRNVSKLVPDGFSALRLACAFARLTYEMPTRTLTVRFWLVSNVTYPPEPFRAGGQPLVPYVVAPLALVPPGVTVVSRQVPVLVNGLS